jgi:hypothetical protein
VRAELREDVVGYGAPEHAAAEQGGAARCDGPGRSREVEQEVGKAQSAAVNQKAREKGEDPNWFGDKEQMGFWSPPGRSVKGGRGQELVGAPIGRQGDDGDVAVHQWRAEAYGRHGAGVKGVFPRAEHTRRRPRRARQRGPGRRACRIPSRTRTA